MEFLRKLILSSVLTLIAIGVHAQDSKLISIEGFFEAQLGFKRSRLYDEVGSNLQYSGFSIPVGLAYYTMNDRYLLNIAGSYYGSKLTNGVNDSSIEGLGGDAEVHYAKSISTFLESTLFVGGQLHFQKNFRKQNNFFFEASSTTEWYTAFGPSIAIARNTGDNQALLVRLYTSVISYLEDLDSRSSPGNGFLAPNKLNDYRFHVKYIFKSNRDMYVNLNYNFDYYRVDRNLFDVRQSGHSFSLGFLVNL